MRFFVAIIAVLAAALVTPACGVSWRGGAAPPWQGLGYSLALRAGVMDSAGTAVVMMLGGMFAAIVVSTAVRISEVAGLAGSGEAKAQGRSGRGRETSARLKAA